MTKQKRTLVAAIDFSASTDAILSTLTELAGPGDKIILSHAIGSEGISLVLAEPMFVPPPVWQRVIGDKMGYAESRLEPVVRALRSFDVEVAITSGEPAKEILELAKDRDAGLVVMGSHGATGPERLFFGSTAETVSRGAHCPVLVTKGVPGAFKRVVVGVPLDEMSAAIVETARALFPSAVFELVHVLPSFSGGVLTSVTDNSYPELREAEEKARARASELLEATRADAEPAEAVVDVGRPAEVLLRHAHEADLLVVGAHKRRGIERVIGTTAERLLRHCRVPVLLVPVLRE